MKLWQGMLSGQLHEAAERFNASIAIDGRMVEEDITGSIAHAQMLGATGILSQTDSAQIVAELQQIAADYEAGKLPIDPKAEDIHTFVEGTLTERIGEAGKKLHTARSRNDQVATDLRLILRKEIVQLQEGLDGWIQSLCTVAAAHLNTVMPGTTHLQAAQPVTLAFHMMSYAQMALRDKDRLQGVARRMNESPLGACALAGTTYPIDREMTARTLGFDRPMQNAMDAVSDRDFVLELLAALAIVATHISRMAEELILWSSQPYGYIKLSDDFSTGSSIMPQKKNPDMAELMRGKAGRVYGDLIQALTMMKGLPLAYAKDMQEDKESVLDAVDTVGDCLQVLAPMLETMTVDEKRLKQAAEWGYLNATDLADYLVGKGIAFRDAHHIAAKIVKIGIDQGKSLSALPLEIYQKECPQFDLDLYDAVDLENCVKRRNSLGGPAPQEVQRQIDQTKKALEEMK